MSNLVELKRAIADCEEILADAWADDEAKEAAASTIEALQLSLPKQGQQWVNVETGGLYVINQFGYAEPLAGEGDAIPPEQVMDALAPYASEEGKKPSCDSSESQAYPPSKNASAAELKQEPPVSEYKELQAYCEEVNVNEDMVAYVWKKYPKLDLSAKKVKLRELADSLDDHPVWAVLFNEITANTVEDVGDWEKRLEADLERYKQQFEARSHKAKTDIEFIDGILLPKICAWAQEELQKNKSKSKYMDFASCRLQLRTQAGDFVLVQEELPDEASLPFCDEKELAEWHVKTKQVTVLDYDLPAMKAKANAVRDQALALERDGKTEEALKLFSQIPKWLRYQSERTTASFTTAPKKGKK